MFLNVNLDEKCIGLLARITSPSVGDGERSACMNLLKNRIVKLNKLESASNSRIHKYVNAAFGYYYRNRK